MSTKILPGHVLEPIAVATADAFAAVASIPNVGQPVPPLALLLREAERKLNAYLFHGGEKPFTASIPARPDEDIDLLLVRAADEIVDLTRIIREEVASLEAVRMRAALIGLRDAVDSSWPREWSRTLNAQARVRMTPTVLAALETADAVLAISGA